MSAPIWARAAYMKDLTQRGLPRTHRPPIALLGTPWDGTIVGLARRIADRSPRSDSAIPPARARAGVPRPLASPLARRAEPGGRPMDSPHPSDGATIPDDPSAEADGRDGSSSTVRPVPSRAEPTLRQCQDESGDRSIRPAELSGETTIGPSDPVATIGQVDRAAAADRSARAGEQIRICAGELETIAAAHDPSGVPNLLRPNVQPNQPSQARPLPTIEGYVCSVSAQVAQSLG